VTLETMQPTTSKPTTNFKQKYQHWAVWSFGLIGLIEGLRLVAFGADLSYLVGIGLLIPVPTCFYLGWRDYRKSTVLRSAVSRGMTSNAAPAALLEAHSA
jgi:hypothetical protein